jgi:phosphonate degradation associated HDIG domain protein
MQSPPNPIEIVDEIIRIFNERGGRHYGEQVTEREHALQCATFARERGETPALVAACLLHDYGHLIHDLGEDIADQGRDARHEDIGASRLKQFFPPEVVDPVRLHVEAKRYLCWKEPAYLAGLSAASAKSLRLQGGPMTDDESGEFERHPHFESAVRLRRYDDIGKVTGMITPSIEDFRDLLASCVLRPN